MILLINIAYFAEAATILALSTVLAIKLSVSERKQTLDALKTVTKVTIRKSTFSTIKKSRSMYKN